jgi:hypothetical protein
LKKIAIFAEGQTEQIFVREFLLRVLDPAKLSFECLELKAHRFSVVPYKYANPHAEIHFMIIDVHGDEGVLSSVREREKDLIEKSGYERIIAMRDMYTEAYIKRSPGRIDDSVTEDFIRSHNAIIQNMTYPSQIRLHFAIMEVEAWFLGMYNLFSKVDPILTVEYIREKLNIDLTITDPQKEYYRPSQQVSMICELCGRSYSKRKDEVESICSNMESADFENARENGKCRCFTDFYGEIVSYYQTSLS